MPDDLITQITRLERDVADLQRARLRPFVELRGDDDRRVRLGLQEDGTWGLRMWDSLGSLFFDETAA